MGLLDLFMMCLRAKYDHTNIGGSYQIYPEGSTLYIVFQCSNGLTDWMFNFLFPRRKKQPYSNMDIPWKCHGGFLRVWDSIKPIISSHILDRRYKKIVLIGYSHGGPIAALCHEYVWFNRPDLRDNLEGYGFGSPRMFYGELTDALAERWYDFKVIKNIGDIVTVLPPKIFGFSHVGIVQEIGYKKRYNCIEAHRPETYMKELANRRLF